MGVKFPLEMPWLTLGEFESVSCVGLHKASSVPHGPTTLSRAMAAAIDDERLAVRHLPVRRQERKKERGYQETSVISFVLPVVSFCRES